MARLPYDPGLVLVVSERTSYILHNLAIADIADSSRYAIYPPVDGWYQPVLPSDGPEYGVFEQIVRDFERDIVEVGTVPISTISYASHDWFLHTAVATTYVKQCATVPDGEVWIVTSAFVVASVATTGLFSIERQGSITHYVATRPTLPAGVTVIDFEYTIPTGEQFEFHFTGLTVGQVVAGGYNIRAYPVD
jgi:hypothetical protein